MYHCKFLDKYYDRQFYVYRQCIDIAEILMVGLLHYVLQQSLLITNLKKKMFLCWKDKSYEIKLQNNTQQVYMSILEMKRFFTKLPAQYLLKPSNLKIERAYTANPLCKSCVKSCVKLCTIWTTQPQFVWFHIVHKLYTTDFAVYSRSAAQYHQ